MDWNGINPAVVYDAVADKIVAMYPCTVRYPPTNPAYTPQCATFATTMLLCAPDGSGCSPSQSLEHDLTWGGGPPLYINGALNIAAGPGLGTQIAATAPKYGGRSVGIRIGGVYVHCSIFKHARVCTRSLHVCPRSEKTWHCNTCYEANGLVPWMPATSQVDFLRSLGPG